MIARRSAATGLIVAAFVLVLLGAQYAGFHHQFGPRLQAANVAYLDMQTKGVQGFHGNSRPDGSLDRQRPVTDDPYQDVLAALQNPPPYLMPTALWAREGYREVATYNRALYLASIGEIGTARTLIDALRASSDSKEPMPALANFLLARFELETLRDRPQPEFHRSAAQYLRRSLQADPNEELARQIFEYLLSFDTDASVLEIREGASADAVRGEGSASAPDLREF